jgi:putative addiction module component (TIGR02574 family)
LAKGLLIAHEAVHEAPRQPSGIMARMRSSALEKEALALPVANRARLAQRLLESLDRLSTEEAEKLWLAEAARRAREIDDGKVRLVTADELEDRVQARLK